jgi:uncharacterized protein (DUF885 family)
VSIFGKAVVLALLVLLLALGFGANEPTATPQLTIEAKLRSSATTVVPPTATATVEIAPTATPVPPSATPAPTPTQVPPTETPTPKPTPEQPSSAGIVEGLRGLAFETFLEASYRQLQLRDPEMLVVNGLAEEYGLDNVCFTDLSPAYVRETQQLESAVLDLLRGYERDTLGPEQQRSYDVYEWYLDDRVRGHAFAYYDYPVNLLTIWGVQNWIVDFMVSYQPITDEQDAEDYIARLAQLDEWVAQLLEGLELRKEAGVVPPRYILLASTEQVEGHLGQRPDGSFDVEGIVLYDSFREKLAADDGIGVAEKERLLAAAAAEVKKTFVPAFVALRDYLRQLASEATADAGVWKLPQGEAYYTYLLRNQTGTEMRPEEIHELGRAEVARIQAEVRATAAEMGYPVGISLAELNERLWAEGGFWAGEALRAGYERLIAGAQAASEAFFGLRPEAALVIEPEPFGSGLAYYTAPPLDGSGPGRFYTNLDRSMPRFILPTVTYHETVPGHHFQGALAREMDLPTFRRALVFNAQAEGWALYAEQLAWEMGLYEDDPLGNLGRLQFELIRAARLVIDTGIHAKGWTRGEAAAYYEESTGVQSSPAAMDRYVILPGQGCGYTVGLLKIRALRQRAMDRLGQAFDIKAFHDLILGQGAIPLAILEQVVEEWIEATVGQ